ncbi:MULTISPECIES: energy transducer TonB [unclassified Arcicella]|uniref:energy transducer TonB n=1 Tax=unclassified Arcicella TaxID=2644986 RepID=UPI00285F808B|nr:MULTISPECIES: energy transducer TonB [unclassified Arcicella]MDR6560832.1 protein TonB [Arcicella sp. BE51]MDR6810716.1 protein TonB [Arcicella sp. BE140]MDR6822066.1 protein TonB [Arcicella sp. BE139]
MENQTVLHEEDETLEDIVFQNRNKAYGAYLLRTGYHKSIKIALGIGIGLFCLAIAAPMILANIKHEERTEVIADVIACQLSEPPKDIPIEPEQTPPPPEKTVVHKTIAFMAPVIVEDDKVTELPPDQETLNNTDAKIGSVTQDGDTGEIPVDDPDKFKTGEGTAPVEVKAEVETEFLSVEVMPEYAGGNAALAKFLQKNLRYPRNASDAGIGGKVYVQFVVGKDGNISNIDILKGLGFGCDEEAQRVIKLMPRWNPGKQSGRNVTVKFTLPIVFQLDQ